MPVVDSAPMGATLTSNGAVFRFWAPDARSVSVRGAFGAHGEVALTRDSEGYWSVEVPGVAAGDEYQFHVVGEGSTGDKRDPFAMKF